MGIRDRWINFLYRAATGSRKLRTLLTPVGITAFGIFTGLFVALAIFLDRWLAWYWPISDNFSWIISGFLIAIGIGEVIWSVSYFLRVRGTPVPFNPPPELVKTGPYRYTRNPMLTGVFLLLFGIGFAIKSLSLVVFFTPLFIIANVWELKHIEEPELVRRLGEKYIAYRQQTPMFIPYMGLKR